MPTLAETSADVLARMLRRLPPSLWDSDPAASTLQRDLYRAVAEQCALWLEQRAIARTMTLLLEAQGVDLDTLLHDYGLKRYLGLADATARQVGMHLLWRPQGTLESLATLADLLLATLPHRTLRTGRSHVHVCVALTHPVTVPYSYWGLVAADTGQWYAVTVDAEVAVASPRPPPGLNVAPGPHTLTSFRVLDELTQPWTVSLRGDTLVVTPAAQALPGGYSTTEPLHVLDGQGASWTLAVQSSHEALVAVQDVAVTTLGFWRLREAESGAVRALWVAGEVPTVGPTAPSGTDLTPGGAALDWVQASDEGGTPWYVHIEADTLLATRTQPAGSGSALPVDVLDAEGRLWRLTLHSGTEAVVTTLLRSSQNDLLVLAPAHAYEGVQLLDSGAAPWWLTIQAGLAVFLPLLPAGAADVTPAAGPYRWLRLFDLAGAAWALAPSTAGALVVTTTPPGGLGTATPQALGDAAGVVWQLGVTAGGTVGTSAAPAVTYGGMATAICLSDASGARWFWRVRDGRLEWSAFLWPDTMDQSPWGDISWLQMTTTTSVPVYVYPTLQGGPTAASAPPLGSSWGWQEPVILVDSAGAAWHLVVVPTTLGAPDYWQVRDETGELASLFIEAEVPRTQPAAPAGGSDQTPGGTPLDTFAVREELTGRQIWVTLTGDTLLADTAPISGVSAEAAMDLQDALGQVWHLDAHHGTEALRTLLASSQWRVRAQAEPLPTIPLSAAPLALRDAVEALAHIQPAGGLVTVRVQ
jgi:hypothetical protein